VAIKGSLITADPNQSLKKQKGGSSLRETASAQRRSVGIYRETRLTDKMLKRAVSADYSTETLLAPMGETRNH
jgi:hypothetical protein